MGDFYFLLLVSHFLIEKFLNILKFFKMKNPYLCFCPRQRLLSRQGRCSDSTRPHSEDLIWRDGRRVARKQLPGQKQSEGGRIFNGRAVNLSIK